MHYCHHHVKCTNPIKKAQTTVIRLLAHHKPLHTMRAVCAYVGTLPKCMQVFARSVRGGDSEAIEQTISNFNAQNIILCGFKIIRKVWKFQTISNINIHISEYDLLSSLIVIVVWFSFSIFVE